MEKDEITEQKAGGPSEVETDDSAKKPKPSESPNTSAAERPQSMVEDEFLKSNTMESSEEAAGSSAEMIEPVPTPTVSSAIERLKSMGDKVSAAAFAQEVLKQHSEYAGGRVTSLDLKETPSMQSAPQWLAAIQALFDWKRIQMLSKSKEPLDLHGRIVVVGLCLIEYELRSQLETAGVFSPLIAEIEEKPFQEILTERGQFLFAHPTGEPPDSVASWPDDPLSDAQDDLLGRNAFARFLDRRIRAVPHKSGAYAIHIYGPWGAGKTSLLNLLKRQLEMEDAVKEPKQPNGKKKEKNNWLVVEFNAWRNQHIQPPWWSLMEQVFITTKKSLGPWNKSKEYWWRFNTGRLHYIVGLLVLAWLLALIVIPFLRHKAPETGTLAYLAEGADNISKILALIATIWGGIFAVNRSLLLGAAQAAKKYNDLIHDPTSAIKRRFADLIHRVPERIVVFIDDLDRCRSRYAVDLLEGIQTLFRDAPVVFVVAADRQWLNGCYEDVYKNLKPRIHEPGKPLGTLFLEKAFRLATPIPGIPKELKESYWDHLLNLKPAEWKSEIAAARETAKTKITEASNEEEVRQFVADQDDQPFHEKRVIREEAVVRLAATEVMERLEHSLQPYLALLEPNPRAMKLLVNAYSANRALALLSEVDIDRHQLALWTILESRWPQLAEFLLEDPKLPDNLNKPGASNVPENVRDLFSAPCVDHVKQVVSGGGIGTELTIETIRQCRQMRL